MSSIGISELSVTKFREICMDNGNMPIKCRVKGNDVFWKQDNGLLI